MSICIEVLKKKELLYQNDYLRALQSMLAPGDIKEKGGKKAIYLNSFGNFLINVLEKNLGGDGKLDILPLIAEIDGFKNEYYFRTILKHKIGKKTLTLTYAEDGTDNYYNNYGNFWKTFDFNVPILKTIPYEPHSMFDDFAFYASRNVIFTRINPYYVEIYLSLLVLLDYLASKLKYAVYNYRVKSYKNKYYNEENTKLIVLNPYFWVSDKAKRNFKEIDSVHNVDILKTYECYANLFNFLRRFNAFNVDNVLAVQYHEKQIEGRRLIPNDKYNDLTVGELCQQIKELEDTIIKIEFNDGVDPDLEDELYDLYEVELEMDVIEKQIENQVELLSYMRKQMKKITKEYIEGFENQFLIKVSPKLIYVKENFDTLTIKEIREFAININLYSYRNYIPTCREVVFTKYSFENSITLDEELEELKDKSEIKYLFKPKRWVKVDFYNAILEDYHFDLDKYLSMDQFEYNALENVDPELILPKWYIENYSEYMVSIDEYGYVDRGYLDFFFEPRERIYHR